MPFFKVLFSNSANEEKRVTTSASSLEELISRSISRLAPSSAPTSYSVYDKSDGSLIDDDECLLGLAEFSTSSKGVHLSVRLLAFNSLLNCSTDGSPLMTPTRNSILVDLNSETPTPSTPSDSTPSFLSRSCVVTDFPPLMTFILDLQEACRTPAHRRNQALIRARSKVVKDIVNKVYKRPLKPGSIMDYCKSLYSGCPAAFDVHIKADCTSSMFPQFVRSVYNAVNYARSLDKDVPRQRQRRRATAHEDYQVDDVEPQVPYLCVDSNGCKEGMWDPAIPDADREILEDKKKELSGYASLPTCDDECVKDLVQDTYSLQRDEINRAKTASDWNRIFASWQILRHVNFLIVHANLLLGKDTVKLWYEEASNHHIIISYMESYVSGHASASNLAKASQLRLMSSIIDCMKESIEATSSDRPNSVAVFPLLVLYFKEKMDNVYLLFQRSTPLSEAVLKGSQESECPIILVRGSSIFDATASTCVLVRGKFVIETQDFTESVLALFLSYFVFNVAYPKTVARTTEFIQRFFLHMNPEFQSRCDGSRKVKINCAVRKLASALTDFELLKSRWSLRG